MSYRDDHDAALLRVAALESELAQLRKAKAELPAVSRKPFAHSGKLPAIALSVASVAAFGALMAAVHFGAAAEAAPPLEVVAPTPAPSLVAEPMPDLHGCLQAITPIGDAIDATTMDPRGHQAVSIGTIERSGAGCRNELGRALAGGLSTKLRERLSAWYATENELANTISLISVYYGNNPVALDNYATAPQLWTEYHRARLARDRAIDGLAEQL